MTDESLTTPQDPRDWTPRHVEAFAGSAEPDEVSNVLRLLLANPDEHARAVIASFLGTANSHVMLKPAASQLATRALLAIGPTGVDVLRDRLLDANARFRYRANGLAALWQASSGRSVGEGVSRPFDHLSDLEIPPETQAAAERAVRDVFAEALIDPDAFGLVAEFAHNRAGFLLVDEGNAGLAARDIMALFAEASIKLSRSVLEQFEALIAREEREEEYQQFLSKHPVLLDPLAAEVVPKQRLGVEFATDFAIRRHDGVWKLVEIERPQDEIFTQGNDFRERFTHAFGQALDFQHWVDDNVAYAQRHMPEVTAPQALVVIGLRAQLSEPQQAKLRRFDDNSRRVDVATFDDLLARSWSLYENLRHHEPV